MSQISVNKLTFGYESSVDNVFENASFTIDTDWKLGFIGRNGKGKTTFLRLLAKQYPYSGSIDAVVNFEYFPYELTAGQIKTPAADFIGDIRPEGELWRVICELSQLGEDADILYRPYDTLSFGERTKILLAVLFSGENDFLLIDEPTNHLDMAARESVKEYLCAKKGFILVSHDRELLDACIDHVLVLNRKTIEVQRGNFSIWWENKEKKDRFAAAEDEKHRREIKKLKQAAKRTSDWADKSERTKIGGESAMVHDRAVNARAYIGSKTKKMQSRAKHIEKRIGREIQEKEGLLQDLEEVAGLRLTQLLHHSRKLVDIKDYGLRYAGASVDVLSGVTFSVEAGERVALHGANGCGKTTLIRRILQKAGMCGDDALFSEEGECVVASGLVISYVGQDTSDVRGDIDRYCGEHGLDKSMFCTMLRKLDFERDQFSKDMENYSQGQKKKVLLASSLLTPAHLYIWDEPLNNIDVFSVMQIGEMLMKYQPTMLFVEHDARFRREIATKVISL